MIIKLFGLGFKGYLRDSFNLFDGIIVMISIIDSYLAASLDNADENAIMTAFRSLRLLRVVKLARIWEAFQEILQRIMQSLIDVSNFSFILLLFIFMFALLGMELFAFIAFYDTDGELVVGPEAI